MKRSCLIPCALILMAVLQGCGSSPESDAHAAANRLIAQAQTAEERVALEKARDDAIDEIRGELRKLDDEIKRLREANAALEKELAE